MNNVSCESALANTSYRTPVTYYQLAMQKRLPINLAAMQGKPYASYFNSDLRVPPDMVDALTKGPLAPEHILLPTEQGLETLLQRFAEFPLSGYAVIEEEQGGPCAYTQSRHIFPGVTTAMLEWWFCWHPIENERYYLWFPHAHIHNSVADPGRLANRQLSYGERLYNNPNHITEYIGDNYLDAIIHFDHPEKFGLNKKLLLQNNFTFNASGLCTPHAAPSVPVTLMLHLGRDTPAGLEMINRYWIGSHDSWDRFEQFPEGGKNSRAFAKQVGMNRDYLEQFAFEMAVHDMTEFTTLGRLLPALYQQFGEG